MSLQKLVTIFLIFRLFIFTICHVNVFEVHFWKLFNHFIWISPVVGTQLKINKIKIWVESWYQRRFSLLLADLA